MALRNTALSRVDQLNIRPAENFDIDGIIEACSEAITKCCAADHLNNRATIRAWLGNKTPESVLDWITKKDSLILVAEQHRKIVGTALATDTGYVSLMYVHPDYQRLGIGRQLLRHIEFTSALNNCESVDLKSTQTACDFYERMGYLITGKEEIFLGMLVVPMAKRIAV